MLSIRWTILVQPLKEYQIATEVLGRPVGFDPQSDSTVRVQAGRLRVKLAEYYANEGVDDAIIVEIPKGSYALTFHLRPTKAGAQPATLVLESEARKQDVPPSTRGWAIAVFVLSVLLAATISTTAILLSQRIRTATQPADSCRLPDSLESFFDWP